MGGADFATMGATTAGILLGAVFFGLGSATMLMINPALIVAAGLEADDEALRLARFNQTIIIGSLITGLVFSTLPPAGLTFALRFLVMSAAETS